MGVASGKFFAKLFAPSIIFSALAGGWFFRAAILGAMLHHAAVPILQSQVSGLAVQFESVDTNLISRLRINQLVLDYCQGDSCLKAKIPAATLSYSLAKIFPWHGLQALIPQLSLNLDSPAVTGALPAGDSSTSETIELPGLPILPALRVIDGSVDISSFDGAKISGRGVGLNSPRYLPFGRAPYQLRLTAEQLSVSGSGFPRQEGAVALTLHYRHGRLEVPELAFAGKTLLKDGLLTADSQGLRFAAELHLLQSSGQVQGSIEQQMAKVSFHLAEGDIEELAGAAGVAPQVSGRLKADGEMTMAIGRPETLAGSVNASIKKGVWDGAAIDHFEVVARAEEQKVFVDTLSFSISGSQITLRDAETPIPEAGVTSWLKQLSASRAKAKVRVVGIDTLPPSWSAPLLDHWQALGLKEVTGELILEGSRLLVAQAKVSGTAGQVRLKDGELDLSADVTDWMDVPWSVLWQAELSDSAVIHYFWEDWPAVGGTVTGKGEFSGTLADPHLPSNVTITGASLLGIPLAKVTGKLTWTKDRLALDVAAFNKEHDQLSYQGTIDLDKGELLATTVSTNLGDLADYLPRELAHDLQLSGTFTGSAAVSGDVSRLKGKVDASGDWEINGIKLTGALVDLVLAGDSWGVRNASGRISDAVTFDAAGKLTPGAGWKSVDILLDTLHLSSLGQDLSLNQAGSVALSSETITVGMPLELHGDLGTFRLSGALGGKGKLSLAGEGVSDTGLLRQLWGKDVGFKRFDFTLGLTGKLSQPEWRWQGTIQELTSGEAPFSLSGRFDLASTAQGLLIKQFELGDDGQSMTFSGQLPLGLDKGGISLLPNPLSLTGHVAMPEAGILPHLFPEWLAESGAIGADLTLTGTWDHPRGQIMLDASGVKPGFRLNASPPGPFAIHGLAQVEGDRLTLSTFDLTSKELSVQTSGSISEIPLAGLLGLQRTDLTQGQVSLAGRYSMENLGWLAARVPKVRRISGSAGGTFAVQGPFSKPEVRMDLTVKNGEARGTDSLLVARGIAVQANLADDQLTITTLSGTLGGAEVQGQGTIKGISSSDPELDVHMTGKDLLLYRADGVKVRANSSLVLGGTFASPQLKGEVLLADSRITKKVNWLALFKPGTRTGGNEPITLFSFSDPPLKDLRFNLRIKGAQPLVISNNVFKGELRPDLTLAGTGELPNLTGVIYADSGRITLPSGRLDLERGLVRFSEESPDRPSIEVQAGGRMMGYDITAQVKGVYDEPEVTLSSSPPLSNEDLLMLLLTGRQPVNASGSSGSTGGMSSVAVYFGRGLLSRVLSTADDEFELFERLEVDVGRALSLQGEPTVDARFKLSDVEWKHDTTIYLTGEKDVWDYYNTGIRVVFRFH